MATLAGNSAGLRNPDGHSPGAACMHPLVLICSHCGSEHPMSARVPDPASLLTCMVCRHTASHAQWVTKTERELAAMSFDRIHDVSRQRS